MNTAARRAGAALAIATAWLLAGCGSAAPGPAPEAPGAGAPFLATSLVTPAGTWAVAVMGGSAASHNNFWQLFVRPAGSTGWKLVTPRGAPDNGGLVLAAGGRSMITAFRPSQYLTFTPLTATANAGQAWSAAGPLDAALADVPDALSAAPGGGGGHLLALTTAGSARLAGPGFSSWSTLATVRSLAATAAGRRCGLQNLTAAAFSPAQMPLLGGNCGRPGATGIFADAGGTWRAAGPALPSSLAGQHVRVLRLTGTPSGTVALLQAGAGPAATLLAAWSADGGGHWALSPGFALHGAAPASASFGPGAAVSLVLTGGRGETVAGPAASWRPLPALPPGTATLAAGPAGQTDALAVDRTRLAVWQLRPGSAWAKAQVMNVPIQFGSSS